MNGFEKVMSTRKKNMKGLSIKAYFHSMLVMAKEKSFMSKKNILENQMRVFESALLMGIRKIRGGLIL